MTAREPLQRLHNMSAPPRATISFRPVAQGGGADAAPAATGLRWVCRIDVAGVFWPIERRVMRDPVQIVLWLQTLEPQRRLLAQALAEARGQARPGDEEVARIAALPAAAVLDALHDLASRLDPAALGLPAFGLLRPALFAPARDGAGQMRRAVAVLARRRGGIFLRQADPLPLDSVWEAFDLWTPEPASASQSSFIEGRSLPPAPRVVPAQAGTQRLRTASRRITAFAAMTGVERGGSTQGKAPNGARE